MKNPSMKNQSMKNQSMKNQSMKNQSMKNQSMKNQSIRINPWESIHEKSIHGFIHGRYKKTPFGAYIKHSCLL
jgi:hypothetical protein